MTFKLVVEFAGLCGFLVHSDGQHVGVYMPDGRKPVTDPSTGDDGRPRRAQDGDLLVPHVGYLRYNLADAGAMVPGMGREDSPSYEVIHRFDRESLEFPGLAASRIGVSLALPEVERFAPDVKPDPDLFSRTPPKALLMRSILSGGLLEGTPDDGLWRFSRALNPRGQDYGGEFAGFSTWTREIDDTYVDLRLRRFGDTSATTIRLAPIAERGVVRLKIANLCAVNVLEWPELYLRMFNDVRDEDFKWFYQLWVYPGSDFETVLGNAKLPVPELVGTRGGVTDCTGSQQRSDFDLSTATTALMTSRRART